MNTSYILTYRESGDPARHANLLAVIAWLKTCAMNEIILVEQDAAPTLRQDMFEPGVNTVFAYNPGPFNKSWGFNIGAKLAHGAVLVFGDADTVCLSLDAAVRRCATGTAVVRAFSGIWDLDEEQTHKARNSRGVVDVHSLGGLSSRALLGEHVPLCSGVVLFDRSGFAALGGWDERFQGWGGEDDAMSIKVQRSGLRFHTMDTQDGFHLQHIRATASVSQSPLYQQNLSLLDQLQRLSDPSLRRLCEVSYPLCGDVRRHRPMNLKEQA